LLDKIMASGAVHDRLILWTAPVVAGIAWQVTGGGTSTPLGDRELCV